MLFRTKIEGTVTFTTIGSLTIRAVNLACQAVSSCAIKRAMTRAHLIRIFKTNTAIAEAFRAFGVKLSPQAIQSWPLDDAIPPLREYQLRENRPDLFAKKSRRA